MSQEIVHCYVDGGYVKGRATWGFIVINKDNKLIHKSKGKLIGSINKMNQIGGEIYSAMQAVEYCRNNNYKCLIFFDFVGIKHWVADIFGKQPWKAKNHWTKQYREFMILNKEYIEGMVKVKSHSGNYWNEYVDKYIKESDYPSPEKIVID